MPDHVHMMISIPPKYAVSQVVGYIKGEECDPYSSGVWREEEELCGPAFLGEGILCIDGRPGRGGDPGVYSSPGSGGSPIGADGVNTEIDLF